MQPLNFVRHEVGSYSEADPQPKSLTTSDSLDIPKVANESALEMGSVVDDSEAEAYDHRQ